MENPGADLQRFAGTLLAENDMDRELTGEAVETVQKVTQSDIWKRACRSERRFTEIPFQILKEDAPVPTVLRGAIDLIFKENGGWVLVDYKTDVVSAKNMDALVEKYRPQLQVYAGAWEVCTGEKVFEKGIFFIKADEYRSV
jgi:ATP-dependent helicase/nuclease subunit A